LAIGNWLLALCISHYGFPYIYSISTDAGKFGYTGGIELTGPRYIHFTYDYAAGQWSGGFLGICGTGFNASFIADGITHDLGNGWRYKYVSSSQDGPLGAWFRPSDQYASYVIEYNTWQWWHGRGGSNSKAYDLGKPWYGMTQSWSEYGAHFIGDGNDHLIHLEIGGREIHYRRSGDWGIWWNMSSYPRQGYTYEYDYKNGTWYKWNTYYQNWALYDGPGVDPYFNPNVPPDPD